ncbi:hypothetical protein ACEQ8H_006144 [Pleosporales sp. CAS-2024a]
MSTPPTPYRPSPLSFASPRQSPFRRPGSIRERSPSAATPTSSPLKPKDTPATPAWLNTRGTATAVDAPPPPSRNLPSPTRNVSSSTLSTVRPLSTASLAARFDAGRERPSPEKLAPVDKPPPADDAVQRPAPLARTVTGDAMSKLPPPLLHSMRESFSVMDRDNDGHVNAADVADMLSQLGLSATPSTLASYFNGAQSINLATFLNTLSDLLSGLSRSSELSAAFEAFDDGDDGQIDLAELKDALLHTAPEPGERKLTEREIDMVVDGFSGRRAFGKGAKGLARSEVFRYQEFMASLTGGSGGDPGENAAAPA